MLSPILIHSPFGDDTDRKYDASQIGWGEGTDGPPDTCVRVEAYLTPEFVLTLQDGEGDGIALSHLEAAVVARKMLEYLCTHGDSADRILAKGEVHQLALNLAHLFRV